jgi:hypothetical protein
MAVNFATNGFGPDSTPSPGSGPSLSPARLRHGPACSFAVVRRRGQRPPPDAGIDGAECSSLASRHGRFRRKLPPSWTWFGVS